MKSGFYTLWSARRVHFPHFLLEVEFYKLEIWASLLVAETGIPSNSVWFLTAYDMSSNLNKLIRTKISAKIYFDDLVSPKERPKQSYLLLISTAPAPPSWLYLGLNPGSTVKFSQLSNESIRKVLSVFLGTALVNYVLNQNFLLNKNHSLRWRCVWWVVTLLYGSIRVSK